MKYSRAYLATFLIFLGTNVFWLSTPKIVSAHAFGYEAIKTELTVTENKIRFVSKVPRAVHLNQKSDEDKRAYLEQYLNDNFQILQGDSLCTAVLFSAVENTAQDETFFTAEYTCPSTIEKIEEVRMHVTFFALYISDFDHFVLLHTGGNTYQLVFTIDNQDFPDQVRLELKNDGERYFDQLATSAAAVTTEATSALEPIMSLSTLPIIALQFFGLGVKHILTGYDHILFLLAAILLLRQPKKIIILVTSFTLAHSLTLVLAGLKIISLPSQIVEPIIAVSIVVMAIRNISILRTSDGKIPMSERWFTTFGFGLLHGLGFAGSLLSTGIPNGFFLPALVLFNLGIELGQLAILLLVVPLLFWVDKTFESKKSMLVISLCILALALYWLGVRVVGSLG